MGAQGTPEFPLACALTVFDLQERHQHLALGKALRAICRDVQELQDGYAFLFSNDASIRRQLSQWIALERRCCPFLAFALTDGADRRLLWLQVTGPVASKRFAYAALGFGRPQASSLTP